MSPALNISKRAIYITQFYDLVWPLCLWFTWSETPMTGFTASGLEWMQSLVFVVPKGTPDQTFAQDQQGASAHPLPLAWFPSPSGKHVRVIYTPLHPTFI